MKDWACSTHGEKRNAYRILVGKPEIKEPLGRTIHRLEYNIKVYLRYDGAVWTGLIWIRIWNSGGLM
jgi:hypothetical protein